MSTITAPEVPIADVADSHLEAEITPEELLTIPDGKHYELIDGELKERNVSGLSSHVAANLNADLNLHCRKNKLGRTFGADCGYQCFPWKPKNIRRPDVSFIRADRITLEDLAEGYIKIAPDLAVEVISPNDTVAELEEKLEEYLRAGVRLIWIVYPETRTVHIRRADGSMSRLRETDELSGEDVVPEFRCPLGSLFPAVPITETAPAAS